VHLSINHTGKRKIGKVSKRFRMENFGRAGFAARTSYRVDARGMLTGMERSVNWQTSHPKAREKSQQAISNGEKEFGLCEDELPHLSPPFKAESKKV